MPTASLSDPWLPGPTYLGKIPLGRFAAPVRVWKCDTFGEKELYLPNVRCTAIEHQIGTHPGTASLRYVFDPHGAAIERNVDHPTTVEEALSTAFGSAFTVEPFQRIKVLGERPDATEVMLFDGFAVGFKARMSRGEEKVDIDCIGVASRLWDQPIRGSWIRAGDAPKTVNDTFTEVYPHFNPKGKGNCCPDGKPRGAAWRKNEGAPAEYTYPTFLDPDNSHKGDEAPRLWDLSRAARFLIYAHNEQQLYVYNPDPVVLDQVLIARIPKPGVRFQFSDPSTWTASEIVVPDKPIHGKGWPNVLHDLIADRGYQMRWSRQLPNGEPTTYTKMEVFLPQDQAPKSVWLQPRGSDLDLALTNLGSMDAGRDVSQVVNCWTVEGELEEFEASFVLYAGYPADGDEADSPASIETFKKTHPTFAERSDKFRLYLLDESGEGSYEVGSNSILREPTSLDEVLGEPLTVGGVAVPQYAYRRRPPLGTLISKDANGVPRKARLDIATDFGGPYGVWDGTGTWQPVTGGWDVEKGRIGVRLTEEDVNSWKIGKPATPVPAGTPFPDGVVKGVECIVGPQIGRNVKFWLRLTCVIRGDKRCQHSTNPSPFNVAAEYPVRRVVDAHDRYKKQTVCANTPYNDGADVVRRDDSTNARAEAELSQIATENGVFGGKVTIPRLTDAYQVGDRIDQIQGRSLRFQTNNDITDHEPVYPVVTRVTHSLEHGQWTQLELSDANASRHTYLAQVRRRADRRDA